jgi:SAM-dependent methyltransferase
VVRWADLVPAGSPVLDVACGSGRHTRFFLDRGHPVVAIDIDVSGVADLEDDPRVEIVPKDLEDGSPFPLRGRHFGGVIVTDYLWRPLFDDLVDAVQAGGVLIYKTFAVGQERFGQPTNPDFLLKPGELLEAVRGQLRVVAYEDLIVDEPRPAAVQRICAVRPGD